MDYRCPSCRKDLGNRKGIQAIITRMEIDCSFCGRRIRLNVHPLERGIVFSSFGSFVALAALAYSLHSNMLVLVALAVGMAGPTALPVLERTYLRNWARYLPAGANPGGNRS
jgi:DNA-directed RNA polymerase subunit RPC12/RpoP